jgi:tRNA1Val (adenine37-N6)-methyltransferase
MARQSYFALKQFVVHQDKCAMKVCTDSCLFGAWLVEQLQFLRVNYKSALDIGTGTGLLSMMLAQELSGYITGIDMDPAAVAQARENVAASPFESRIEIIESRLQKFESTQYFDLVFSNPPFFEGQLMSPNNRRSNAMHSAELNASELLDGMDRLISIDGWAALLMPAYRTNELREILFNRNFYIYREAFVCQTENHEPFRVMWLFSRNLPDFFKSERIYIKAEGAYTDRFTGLLKQYYLNF